MKHQSGFTLIEVLVVVVILAALAALVGPRLMGRMDDAKVAEAKIQIRNLENALKLYKLDNGFYPSTAQGLDALVRMPSGDPVPRKYKEDGYLEKKKIPLDPWGNSYIYVCPGQHGDFDIQSYGGDGKQGGDGKDADIGNWALD